MPYSMAFLFYDYRSVVHPYSSIKLDTYLLWMGRISLMIFLDFLAHYWHSFLFSVDDQYLLLHYYAHAIASQL